MRAIVITISGAEWGQLDPKYRIRLHNSLLGGKPVHLVGTISKSGITNLAVFNSACHVSSNPPLIGMMCRPEPERRDTYTNIQETGVWTLSAVHFDYVQRAHRASDKIPRDQSEFDHTGLTPYFQDEFVAPSVAESPLQIGLAFREEIELKSSGTVMLVGEVQWLRIVSGGQAEDGSLQAERLGILSSLGLDAYASVTEVARFEYHSSQDKS